MAAIILTGGGTAGHVTPHLALLPGLQKQGWDVHYIGSRDGIERELIRDLPYYPIATGKFRRYFSWKNFTDPFRVAAGTFQAWRLLGRLRPQVVFSKGGFVSVPVAIAAWLRRIPVVLHESDLTPGLANRLAMPFARVILVTFAETEKYLGSRRVQVVGTPIRESLLKGNRAEGLKLCGFDDRMPVLLAVGGSLGAAAINQALRDELEQLTSAYQIIHLCGRGNRAAELEEAPGYCQFEYADDELPHLLAAADVVLSRAGANVIHELLAAAKPNLLIPLSRRASRGDQIANARAFAEQGFSRVLPEEELSSSRLRTELDLLYQKRHSYIRAMQEAPGRSGTNAVLQILAAYRQPQP